jgi:hypothetical protein
MLDASGDIRRESSFTRVPVERRARGHVRGNIRDVHPRADPITLLPEAERVVEVLGLVWIDREGEELAEVGAIGLELAGRSRHRRVRPADAFLPEEPLEHRAHILRLPQDALHPRPPAAQPQDGQIADRCVAASLAVDGDRDPSFEEGLAHQELPAPGELGDEGFHVATRPAA